MWNRIQSEGEYIEIVPGERLVYTDSMADEKGNVVSPPAQAMTGDDYPETTEVTVLLEDLGGRTRMVLTHAGLAGDEGANEGWAQAFAKLADYVETVLNDN